MSMPMIGSCRACLFLAAGSTSETLDQRCSRYFHRFYVSPTLSNKLNKRWPNVGHLVSDIFGCWPYILWALHWHHIGPKCIETKSVWLENVLAQPPSKLMLNGLVLEYIFVPCWLSVGPTLAQHLDGDGVRHQLHIMACGLTAPRALVVTDLGIMRWVWVLAFIPWPMGMGFTGCGEIAHLPAPSLRTLTLVIFGSQWASSICCMSWWLTCYPSY